MKTKLNFNNKNILVTGGSGFLGSKIVKAFLEFNANVYVMDLKLNKKFKAKYFIKTDLSKKENIDRSFNHLKKKNIKIHSLINCINYHSDNTEEYTGILQSQSYEIFKSSLDINLTSHFYVIKKFSKLMKNYNSSIINISSIYSFLAPDNDIYKGTSMGNSAAYSSAKGAINQLTKWFASQLSPRIRVNCISLGGVFNNQNEKFVKKYSKKVLLKRMAKPNEIVGPVLFLASEMSTYVNGENIIVDGGLSKKI